MGFFGLSIIRSDRLDLAIDLLRNVAEVFGRLSRQLDRIEEAVMATQDQLEQATTNVEQQFAELSQAVDRGVAEIRKLRDEVASGSVIPDEIVARLNTLATNLDRKEHDIETEVPEPAPPEPAPES